MLSALIILASLSVIGITVVVAVDEALESRNRHSHGTATEDTNDAEAF